MSEYPLLKITRSSGIKMRFVHPSLCLAAGIPLRLLRIYSFQNKRRFFDGMANEILLRQGSRGLKNGKGAPARGAPHCKVRVPGQIPPNRLQLLARVVFAWSICLSTIEQSGP